MNIFKLTVFILQFIFFFTFSIIAQENKLKISTLASDSTDFNRSAKWLNLKDWYKFNQNNISLEYKSSVNKFEQGMFNPSRVMPKDPFKLDYRGSSYYVPQMVKDELTLMMNRPKDNAFMPILGVAFLAAQLAAKYVIVQEKIKILPENILKTLDCVNILVKIWEKNPQTLSQLFEIESIRQKYTMNILEQKVNSLLENKLIKQKLIEKNETQYFPAISKAEYLDILQKINEDTISNETKSKVYELRKALATAQ